MSTISSQEIISIIKGEIADFDAHAGEIRETGTVIWVGDGIAIVYGIDHAMYGEIVIFECGVKGMVQDIRKNEIGCILFGKDTEIVEGSRVTRTKKRAGVPVGNAFLAVSYTHLDALFLCALRPLKKDIRLAVRGNDRHLIINSELIQNLCCLCHNWHI